MERMDIKKLTTLARAGVIDTVIVAAPDPFGRQVGKRFHIDFFLKAVASQGKAK